MANEKKRILLLFHILSSQAGYVRSYELAEKACVTERTIKNDIRELRDFCKASGATLHSRKGKGYYLEIVDRNCYKQVKDQMNIHFMYKNETLTVQKNRTNDILRRIICEANYLTIDDIADELYLTKSSIKEEMQEVNEILKSFNMSFRKKNESGYLIKGSEFDRRMLMLSLFEVYYHEAIPFYKSSDFTQFFYRDDQERYDIRHIFLEVMREERCFITDEQRLSRYLCLMSSRFNSQCKVTFKEEQIKWIQTFKQYQVAKKVVHRLRERFHDFDVDDNEVAALGLVFLFFDNIAEGINLNKDYKLICKEVNEFIQDYVELIRNEYQVNLSHVKNYERILFSVSAPLIIQKEFKSASYLIFNYHTFDRQLKNSLFSTNFAMDYGDLFYKKYKQRISLISILNVANAIRIILSRINFSFKPVKAMVTTQSGFEASYHLRDVIKGRFNTYFEKLDVYEFYDMRRIKKTEYDYVILSLPYFTYKYEWPCLVIDDVPTQQQLNDIYNQIVLKGVQLESIVKKMELPNINIYHDFDFDHYESFIKLISFKIANSSTSINHIEKELKQTSEICCYRKICIVFVKRKYTMNQIVDLYHLKQTKLWRDKEINDVLVLSVDFKFDLEIVRFINDLLYQISNNTELTGLIIDQSNSNTLIEIVRDSLKALPISLK